jgi:hypothetical protein
VVLELDRFFVSPGGRCDVDNGKDKDELGQFSVGQFSSCQLRTRARWEAVLVEKRVPFGFAQGRFSATAASAPPPVEMTDFWCVKENSNGD